MDKNCLGQILDIPRRFEQWFKKSKTKSPSHKNTWHCEYCVADVWARVRYFCENGLNLQYVKWIIIMICFIMNHEWMNEWMMCHVDKTTRPIEMEIVQYAFLKRSSAFCFSSLQWTSNSARRNRTLGRPPILLSLPLFPTVSSHPAILDVMCCSWIAKRRLLKWQGSNSTPLHARTSSSSLS